jgi:hypothetical protein
VAFFWECKAVRALSKGKVKNANKQKNQNFFCFL